MKVPLTQRDVFNIIDRKISRENNRFVFSNVERFCFQTLGKFMCSFVPMGNTIAILSSSLTLSVIALDRYQNVMSGLTTMWNPSPLSCIGMVFALLFFSCGKLMQF